MPPRRCARRVVAVQGGNGGREDEAKEPAPPEVPPAPEVDFEGPTLQLPREVVEQLRNQVFGFDTFFVTKVENYDANGVLFQGNLRGNDPAAVHARLQAKLQALLGDEFTLYLLADREDKPVAVVLPTDATRPPTPLVPQAALAAVFGVVTLATTLSVYGVALPFGDPDAQTAAADVAAALPGTAAFLGLLAVHEAGHRAAAAREGVALQPPVLIPAGLGLIGSFGAITLPDGPLPNRTALLRIAAAGPAAGAAASLAAVLAGFALSGTGMGGVEVQPEAFKDSLLMGTLGSLLLGGQLQGDEALNLSPLLLAGWAGLVVNGLNTIPAGDVDGARIASGLWGRRAGRALSTVTLLLLGLAGIIDTLALFWVLIIVFLQRGPILPQKEEIASPQDGQLKALGVGLLLLPLLVLLPFPGPIGVQDAVDAMETIAPYVPLAGGTRM